LFTPGVLHIVLHDFSCHHKVQSGPLPPCHAHILAVSHGYLGMLVSYGYPDVPIHMNSQDSQAKDLNALFVD
jgi:hypothetical protein